MGAERKEGAASGVAAGMRLACPRGPHRAGDPEESGVVNYEWSAVP
jgi:hypothetical protein